MLDEKRGSVGLLSCADFRVPARDMTTDQMIVIYSARTGKRIAMVTSMFEDYDQD